MTALLYGVALASLPKELRAIAARMTAAGGPFTADALRAAADEIERLRGLVEETSITFTREDWRAAGWSDEWMERHLELVKRPSSRDSSPSSVTSPAPQTSDMVLAIQGYVCPTCSVWRNPYGRHDCGTTPTPTEKPMTDETTTMYYECAVCAARWTFTLASQQSAIEQFAAHREALGHNYAGVTPTEKAGER